MALIVAGAMVGLIWQYRDSHADKKFGNRKRDHMDVIYFAESATGTLKSSDSKCARFLPLDYGGNTRYGNGPLLAKVILTMSLGALLST